MELGNSLVGRYLQQMPEATVARHFEGQDAKQVSFTLSYTPPWELPSEWNAFLNNTFTHRLSLPNEQELRMSLMEQVLIRQTAMEVVGSDTSEAHVAAHRLFKWVGDKMEWGNSLGKSPIAVIRSHKANYAQSAMVFGLLARSVFIPVRFVDEVAFAPADKVRTLTRDWDSLPLPYRLWYGKCFWYHIWCEIYLDGCWIPCDPVTGLWGQDDVLVHVRCRDMLKLVVRSRDIRRGITADLRPRYVLDPLDLTQSSSNRPIAQQILTMLDRLALPLDQPLHRCRELYRDNVATIENLVNLVNEWQSEYGSEQFLKDVAYDDTHESFFDRSIVEPSLQAVYGLVRPITLDRTLCRELLSSFSTLVILAPGREYTKTEKESLRDWVESGGQLSIFYGSWGSWLDASIDLMQYFGVELSDSLVDNTEHWRGKLELDTQSGSALEDELALIFARPIQTYPPNANRVRDSRSQKVLLVRFPLGRGSLLVAPASILTKSSPYTQSHLSSASRRLLRRILGLGR